jgi:hypothetical protein
MKCRKGRFGFLKELIYCDKCQFYMDDCRGMDDNMSPVNRVYKEPEKIKPRTIDEEIEIARFNENPNGLKDPHNDYLPENSMRQK